MVMTGYIKMGNKFEVEVNESKEELKHRLHHAVTASSKERLQMLYWLKQNAIATRKELSQKLGRDESTIYRWLKRYRQGGLTNLLEMKTPPGKKSQISEREMNQLKQRLIQPQGFKSYGEIQDWLNQEFGIDLAYKTVHKIVRYKLKAKLKTPRPQSQKTKPQVQDAFKKNSKTSLKY
jgi:transposase